MGESYTKPDGLDNFLNACDEFIQGKFILADIKISKILRAISTSKEVYNLMAESLINYNFRKEYSELKKLSDEQGKDFELPKDTQSVISFVFAMLVEIDSKRIDFSELLSTTFPYATSQREEYAMFSQKFIIPFKNAVSRMFGIIPDGETSFEEDSYKDIMSDDTKETEQERDNSQTPEEEDQCECEPHSEDTCLLFDGIARKCLLIDEKLQHGRQTDKRANILLLTRAMKESCNMRKINIVIALVMALNELSRHERSIKNEIREINEICFQFYS